MATDGADFGRTRPCYGKAYSMARDGADDAGIAECAMRGVELDIRRDGGVPAFNALVDAVVVASISADRGQLLVTLDTIRHRESIHVHDERPDAHCSFCASACFAAGEVVLLRPLPELPTQEATMRDVSVVSRAKAGISFLRPSRRLRSILDRHLLPASSAPRSAVALALQAVGAGRFPCRMPLPERPVAGTLRSLAGFAANRNRTLIACLP